MEQFDDILRTFINETNKFENRFGTIRDWEKMLAVQQLLLEGFRTSDSVERRLSNSELLVALEKIITDKVATVPTARNMKIDTSAPMNIGMAAKGDGGTLRE